MLCLILAAATVASFAASSYGPAAAPISDDLQISRLASLTGVTVFTSGFAVAPMVTAPFSETYGRKPVFVASGLLSLVCNICCSISPTFGGVLAARFLVGVGTSAFSSMVGGVIADMYEREDRNMPMALFSGAAIAGIGLGPLICGFIAENLSWRWVFHLQTILIAVLTIAMILFLHESRRDIVTKQKAKVLARWRTRGEKATSKGTVTTTVYQDQCSHWPPMRWLVKHGSKPAAFTTTLSRAVSRPFRLLCTDLIVFCLSLWAAFSWSVLYIALAAVPLIFSEVYMFSPAQANAVFASSCIGALLATLLGVFQEDLTKYFTFASGTATTTTTTTAAAIEPEARLYLCCIQSLLLPLGLFMFGWTSSASIHWIAPAVAVGLANMGISAVYLAVFNYFADVYGAYASSAIAAQSFARNAMGGVWPLVTKELYSCMGYGPASSFLGGLSILLSIVPWILAFQGQKIRGRSKFANNLEKL